LDVGCLAEKQVAALQMLTETGLPVEPTPTMDPSSSLRTIRCLILIAGLSLLPLLWLAVSVDGGKPTWWRPFPMIGVFTAYMLKSEVLAFLVLSAAVLAGFASLNRHLFHGDPGIQRMVPVVAVLHVLNAVHLIASFSEGVRYLGWTHTVAICGITAVLFVGQTVLVALARRRPNALVALAFHWLTCAWLALYSFPLLTPLFRFV
jgi:hypothetical protein